MIRKIFVPMTDKESLALVKLAEQEKRDPRDQAAYLIRQQLENLGLLPPATIKKSGGGTTA
ncbi:MAG: hypothetical protein JXM69_06325 [Anaerolineae bacterium]|nr:hypothetical protein [Anaerolineae bacterium]